MTEWRPPVRGSPEGFGFNADPQSPWFHPNGNNWNYPMRMKFTTNQIDTHCGREGIYYVDPAIAQVGTPNIIQDMRPTNLEITWVQSLTPSRVIFIGPFHVTDSTNAYVNVQPMSHYSVRATGLANVAADTIYHNFYPSEDGGLHVSQLRNDAPDISLLRGYSCFYMEDDCVTYKMATNPEQNQDSQGRLVGPNPYWSAHSMAYMLFQVDPDLGVLVMNGERFLGVGTWDKAARGWLFGKDKETEHWNGNSAGWYRLPYAENVPIDQSRLGKTNVYGTTNLNEGLLKNDGTEYEHSVLRRLNTIERAEEP